MTWPPSAAAALILTIGLLASSAPALAQAQPDGPSDARSWATPREAFDESVHRSFIHNEFLLASATDGYPSNAVMGFADDEGCPDGWVQLTDDKAPDKAPLFYAFGLLVDANGERRTRYVRVPACVKQ